MQTYLDIFARAAARARVVLAPHKIETHIGQWHKSAVLKLQKPRWTPLAPAAVASEAGLFFSVWIDEPGLARERAHYNVHALRLRSLDYSIRSREFASAFRAALAGISRDWPHLSTDRGPQTLMQGWIELDIARLEQDVVDLIHRFLPLADLIDTLLDQGPATRVRVAR